MDCTAVTIAIVYGNLDERIRISCGARFVLLLLRALVTALAAHFGAKQSDDTERLSCFRSTILPHMDFQFVVAAIAGLAWTYYIMGFTMFWEWKQFLVTVVCTIVVYSPRLKDFLWPDAADEENERAKIVLVTAVPVLSVDNQ